MFGARASATNIIMQCNQCLSGVPQGIGNDSNRAESRFVPSQWEMALLCNDISHWLGTNLVSAWFFLGLLPANEIWRYKQLSLTGHKPGISPEQWASYFCSILSSVDQHSLVAISYNCTPSVPQQAAIKITPRQHWTQDWPLGPDSI